MEQSEPALKPQWLRASNGEASSHGVALSNRNKPALAAVDREWKSFSSCKRSSNANGPRNNDRETGLNKSRAYNNFGSRSSRSRDHDKDFDVFDKDTKPGLPFNEFNEPINSFKPSRVDKDVTLVRSQSLVLGKTTDTWQDGFGNKVYSGGAPKAPISGGSFEKEFPSLSAEEKNARAETSKVSLTSISSPMQSIPLGSSVINGIDQWNSVLVEVPTIGVPIGNYPGSHAGSTNHAVVPSSSGSGVTLNMAEAVAQGPIRVITPPQLSIETQKNDESRKFKTLIPVTPSAIKSSGSILSDKLKSKGGLQLVPACSNGSAAPRMAAKADSSKFSQVGSLQILQREKHGLLLTKESTGASKSPVLKVPLKLPANHRLKGESKLSGVATSLQGPLGDKRSVELAKERHKFFNVIRSKASSSVGVPSDDSGHASTVNGLLDREERNSSVRANNLVSNAEMKHSHDETCIMEQFPTKDGETEAPADPEEEAFLRSLGWDENMEVAMLTVEEIEAFHMKYPNHQSSRSHCSCHQ